MPSLKTAFIFLLTIKIAKEIMIRKSFKKNKKK